MVKTDAFDPERTLTPAVQRSKAARECELIYPKLANAIEAITPGGSRRRLHTASCDPALKSFLWPYLPESH
jgi:hypothetical protein